MPHSSARLYAIRSHVSTHDRTFRLSHVRHLPDASADLSTTDSSTAVHSHRPALPNGRPHHPRGLLHTSNITVARLPAANTPAWLPAVAARDYLPVCGRPSLPLTSSARLHPLWTGVPDPHHRSALPTPHHRSALPRAKRLHLRWTRWLCCLPARRSHASRSRSGRCALCSWTALGAMPHRPGMFGGCTELPNHRRRLHRRRTQLPIATGYLHGL
jgi:hypothetical protein